MDYIVHYRTKTGILKRKSCSTKEDVEDQFNKLFKRRIEAVARDKDENIIGEIHKRLVNKTHKWDWWLQT